MAKKLYEESHIVSIADAIRSDYAPSLKDAKFKTSEMSRAIRDGYEESFDKGYKQGKEESTGTAYEEGYLQGYYTGKDEGREEGIEEGKVIGREEGIEEGKVIGRSEGIDVGLASAKVKFANDYQDNGNRTNYAHAYAGVGWTNDLFMTMRHNFMPSSAYMMFRDSGISGDFVEMLASMGRTFDTSNCTNIAYLFCGSGLTHVGVISVENVNSADHLFRDTPIHTIDEFRLKPNGGNSFGSTFLNAKSLVTIKNITGVIGQNFDIKSSPLDLPSAVNILTHLKDFSGTSDEYKYKITFNETVWVQLDAEGDTASPHGNSWRQYVDDKCWDA